MGNILAEALAEAKAVKKVAVEIARAKLNESLNPKVESILSNKINAEIAEQEDQEKDDQDMTQDLEVPEIVDDENLDETEDPGKNDENEKKDNKDVTSNLSEEEVPEEDLEDETSDEDDLEVESILKELEDETSDDEEVDLDVDDEETVPEEVPDDDDDDEDINVEEILKQVNEDEDFDEDDLENDLEDEDNDEGVINTLESQNKFLKKRLSEYTRALRTLKNELKEVNLLNTKLYHSTQLFKKFNVSEKTKNSIIETFDRAKSTREAKLIYTTLYESLKSKNVIAKLPVIRKLGDIKESVSSSSKTVIRDNYDIKTAILSEGVELKDRWAKLSGQKK